MPVSTLLISDSQLLIQDHNIAHIETNARWRQEKLEEILTFNYPLGCNFQELFLPNNQHVVNKQVSSLLKLYSFLVYHHQVGGFPLSLLL